jgi:hypothetical protein
MFRVLTVDRPMPIKGDGRSVWPLSFGLRPYPPPPPQGHQVNMQLFLSLSIKSDLNATISITKHKFRFKCNKKIFTNAASNTHTRATYPRVIIIYD